MKIIFSPVKRWWKKRLSQKSLVDEKRSGRPSIMRKVQNMFISKSLHKRGRSTRKLASKLTIPGLQCSKDNIHRYLRFDLCSLFMPDTKSPKIRPQMTSVFRGVTAVDSLKTWGISFTDECLVYLSVSGNRKNDNVWAKHSSKLEPIQKSKFA